MFTFLKSVYSSLTSKSYSLTDEEPYLIKPVPPNIKETTMSNLKFYTERTKEVTYVGSINTNKHTTILDYMIKKVPDNDTLYYSYTSDVQYEENILLTMLAQATKNTYKSSTSRREPGYVYIILKKAVSKEQMNMRL